MIGRGPGRIAARLLCAAASAALASVAVAQAVPQQQPPPPDAELDPNAPLAPMPDIGVEWPDLEVREAPGVRPSRKHRGRPHRRGDIRYAFTVEGLSALSDAADLLTAFKAQSVLRPTAGRLPMPRRSSAVRAPTPICWPNCCAARAITMPRSKRALRPARVSCWSCSRPSRRTVSFLIGRASRPRGRRAGSHAASPDLRGQAWRPGHCRTGHRRWSRIDDCARRTRFCQAKVGEQDIEIDHRSHAAHLEATCNPGPVAPSARFG